MMEGYKALVTIVTCMCVLQGVHGGCKEDIMQSSGFAECMGGYGTFMQNAAATDSSQIMTVMCSTEGKSYLSCISDYIMQCPDLTTADGMQALSSLSQMGGLDAMCAMLGGNTGGDGTGDGGMNGGQDNPCMGATQCLSYLPTDSLGGKQMPPGGNDVMGFGSFQAQTIMFCGPYKETLECLDNLAESCPQVYEQMSSGAFQGGSGMGGLDFVKIKQFIKSFCGSIPKDFGNNACVTKKLMQAEQSECVKEASKGVEEPTCEAYNDVLNCLELDECGEAYDASLKQVSEFFINLATKLDCDFTSSCSILSASVFSIVAATVLVVFKLF
ncbi:hypothetical protein ACF0H5_020748 [Mactra antiquata]